MKIIFASANAHKIDEIKDMLPQGIELLGLHDIGCFEEIPETAPTIEGNAILKANYVTQKFGYDCFSDDSGLEVDALDGAPGVHSARYAGEQKNAADNMDKLLAELSGKNDRRANFKTVIALNYKGGQHLFTGKVDGKILEEKRGDGGFGYDPLFLPDGSDRTFAQMTMAEKAGMSHRARAVAQLLAFVESEISGETKA